MQKKRPVWAVLYFYQVYNAEKFLVKKKQKLERANHMSMQNKEQQQEGGGWGEEWTFYWDPKRAPRRPKDWYASRRFPRACGGFLRPGLLRPPSEHSESPWGRPPPLPARGSYFSAFLSGLPLRPAPCETNLLFRH